MTKALVRNEKALALLSRLEREGKATPTSLRLPVDISFEQFEAVGTYLGKLDSMSKWMIGDYLVTGEMLFGERSYQAFESLGLAESTRQRYALVASKVPAERRREDLPWSHHRSVASMEPDEQTKWLEDAVDHDWSSSDLFEQLKAARNPDPPRGDDDDHLSPGTAVVSAARAVCAAAVRLRGGHHYKVPTATLDALAEAVGGGT